MPDSPPRPPVRVLVVDDNDAIRENVQECLELEGYEVVAARDGASALASLASLAREERLPAVMLLDLVMPGMDGRELLRRLRADPLLASVRVVVTTGHTDPAARAGVAPDGFLAKPFGVEQLIAAIAGVLG